MTCLFNHLRVSFEEHMFPPPHKFLIVMKSQLIFLSWIALLVLNLETHCQALDHLDFLLGL